MERELDKIERRFKVYSRELEKEKPVEAETGKEAGTSKTGASVGSDTNSHNKERFATVALQFVDGILPLHAQLWMYCNHVLLRICLYPNWKWEVLPKYKPSA